MEQKRKVYEELNRLAIPYEIINHPAAHTIEEITSYHIFKDNSWIVKNLFIKDDSGRRHFIVVMDMMKRADLKEIRRQLQTSSLGFASEERLLKYLGLQKGSVTPLGILNDEERKVDVVFDSDLIGRERIGVHPNDNTATVMISYDNLEKVIREHGNTIHIVTI